MGFLNEDNSGLLSIPSFNNPVFVQVILNLMNEVAPKKIMDHIKESKELLSLADSYIGLL